MQKYWQGCWNPVACNISPSSIHETAFQHGQKTHNAVCQEAPHFPWKVEYQNATGQRRCFITNALTMTSLSHSIRHQCPSTAGNFLYKHTRISNNWLHVLTIPQLPSRWSQTFTSLSRPHDYKLHCYSSHTKSDWPHSHDGQQWWHSKCFLQKKKPLKEKRFQDCHENMSSASQHTDHDMYQRYLVSKALRI